MVMNVKALMADALIDLCKDLPLSKITVCNITKKAQVGRQTFYNHFRDKNDLIYWVFCRTLDGEKEIISQSGYFAYLSNLYTEAQKYRKFLGQAAALKGQNCLPEEICKHTYRYYKHYIEDHFGKSCVSETLDYALRFNAHGASDMYIRWIEKGMPGTGEEQARLALYCMPHEIKQYLPL